MKALANGGEQCLCGDKSKITNSKNTSSEAARTSVSFAKNGFVPALNALHQLIWIAITTDCRDQAFDRDAHAFSAKSPITEAYNASEMKRKTGLSHQTQKNLLYAFEAIYLIRRIPITGR